MTVTPSTPARVVVTGGSGDVARAIVSALRNAGFEVILRGRGDDLESDVQPGDRIVVLDATSPGGTDYSMVLQAVAHAIGQRHVERLVTVTIVPNTNRSAFLSSALEAETSLRQTGCTLVAVRAGLIVGTPDQTGPQDSALFAEGERAVMPGDGSQKTRPLLLSDLSAVVIDALRAHPAPEELTAEGPEEMTIKELLATLNPGKDVRQNRVGNVSRLLWIAPGVLAGAYFAFAKEPADWVAIAIAGVAAAAWGANLRKGAPDQAALPSTHLILSDDPPRSSILTVTLSRVGDVWSNQAIAERVQKEKRNKAAWRYARTTGSYWIALFLLVLGIIALVLGTHDVFVAFSGLGTRFAGSMLVLAGCTMMLGGVALLTRWHARYALGFVGSVASLATIIVVASASFLSGDGPWPTWFVALYLLIPVALWCCGSLWTKGGLQVTTIMATRGQKVVGSVILGGTLLTLGQVLYSSAYVPATVMPSVSGGIELALAPGKTAQGSSSPGTLTATVTLRNPSSHAVKVLGAFYIAKAYSLADPPASGALSRDATTGGREHVQLGAPRMRVVDRGSLFVPGMVLEGGQELTRTLVTVLRNGDSVAAFRVDLALGRPRYDRQEDATTSYPKTGVTHSVVTIDDPSLLHRLTRSTRYVHVLDAADNELGCESNTNVVAYVDAHQEASGDQWCKEPSRVDDYYGVTVQQLFAESTAATRSAGGSDVKGTNG